MSVFRIQYASYNYSRADGHKVRMETQLIVAKKLKRAMSAFDALIERKQKHSKKYRLLAVISIERAVPVKDDPWRARWKRCGDPDDEGRVIQFWDFNELISVPSGTK